MAEDTGIGSMSDDNNDSLGDDTLDTLGVSDSDDSGSEETPEVDEFSETLEDEAGDTEEEPETETEVEEDEDTKKLNLYQSLKKSSPEVLKAHPELKEILVRENKYSEVFDTPEQAAQVALRAQGLIDLEAKILEGDSKVLLSSLERVNKEQFLDFVHNFLPTLNEVSKDTYTEVMRGPIKRIFQAAFAGGSRSQNENLKNAALVLNDYFFDDEPIDKTTPGRTKSEESPEIKAAREQANQVQQRLYTNFRADVSEVYESKLSKDIAASYSTLKESEFTKRALVKETEKTLNELLSSDKRHQANMASLWRQAQAAGFSREYKAKIYSAALSKAKALLPTARKMVIASARTNKATLGVGKPVAKQGEGKKRFVGDGSRVSGGSQKIDWSKTKERDFLEGKPPVYKK